MEGEHKCAQALEQIIYCKSLGVALKSSKREVPLQYCPFWGNELDMVRLEIRLPRQKLQEVNTVLMKWSGRKQRRKRHSLAHVCKVVAVGRTFLWSLVDLSMRRHDLDDCVTLTQEFRSDLAWWDCIVEMWTA